LNKAILILTTLSVSITSYAYIGPGMSGGVIAAVLGFIAAVFLGMWAILYFPIKRAIRRRKNKNVKSQNKIDDY
tara:strand:+ start:4420 stop:4641 length:222 start_codon:yes stop_codon:yes gene_type:complete